MPFRIAIDIRHIRDFGIGTYIRNLVRTLSRIDQENHYLLTAAEDGAENLGQLPPNFRVVTYPRRDTSKVDNIAYPIFLHQFRVDLYHVPLNRVAWFMPHPYIVTIHDMSTVVFPEKGGLGKALHAQKFRRGLKNATRVLAVSEATSRDVINVVGIDPRRVRQIYNAPDASFLAQLPATWDNASQEWEKQKRIILARYQIQFPFLLYAGIIRPQKNVPRLVEAFAVLRQDLANHPVYSDLRLVIIGDELNTHPLVRQAVIKSRVQHAVRFLGFVPQETMRALYEAAEVFTFPSLYEGFGLAPLEAMTCGTPVVTSNVSSLPEAVGEAAVFVNPENVFDIARGIREVLLDNDLRRDLIQRGYQQVSKFHWDRTASQVLEVYREVASGAPPV